MLCIREIFEKFLSPPSPVIEARRSAAASIPGALAFRVTDYVSLNANFARPAGLPEAKVWLERSQRLAAEWLCFRKR